MARRSSCMGLLVLILALSAQLGASDLSPGYYGSSCPNLESIVRGVVTQKMDDTIRTIGSTIRLFFHDCFVEVRSPHAATSPALMLMSYDHGVIDRCVCMRAGLRRVGADPVDAGEPDGDGRRRQQVAGVRGLRDGEGRQGGRGGRVPRPGLLRRHTHHRHTGRHRPERRALLPGGAGQAGRPELHRQQRGRQAAAAHQHPQPDGRHVQGARAQHVRHRRPLSGAHRGAGALRQVQGPGVRQPGGRDAEPQVRGVPEDQVPRRRLVGPHGAHGPGHAGALRQPVLPEPAGRRGPARLRPAPIQRQPHAPPRQLVGQQHGRLQPGLRRRHRQARTRRGQVRQRREHTQAVRRLQLMTTGIDRSMR
uniref:Plant heme peroxidase family profile domain-containing protein n=1 Tax=Aegilops tauschii subsp. strangulata TaxID=200361 RepID=A0A453LVW0_AEGTS